MSNKKIYVDGVKVPMGELAVFQPDQLAHLRIALPDVRAPLDPEGNPKDAEFVRSIASQGQLQPGGFGEDSEDRVIVYFGAGRFWAIRDHINRDPERWGAKGRMAFTARKMIVKSDADLLDMLRTENDQRREPTIVQRAYAALEYIRLGLTEAQVGVRMGGLSAPRVSQILSVLKHSDRVKALISAGRLNETQARRLLRAGDDLVALVCEKIEAGEKPAAVLRSVSDVQRARGKAVKRTATELIAGLRPLAVAHPLAAKLLAWAEGATVESLKEIIGSAIEVETEEVSTLTATGYDVGQFLSEELS